jgi:hypothetical protein
MLADISSTRRATSACGLPEAFGKAMGDATVFRFGAPFS